MNTKLTLKLDKDVIEDAKEYAKSRKTSLSILIENYLQKLTSKKINNPRITPLVKSLSGIVNLPKTYDEKDEYTNYLIDKYK